MVDNVSRWWVGYEEALEWVMSFWGPGRPGTQERALRRLKVPRMRALLEALGSPHLKYPSVLVAGTKGKGSTVAFIAEGLKAAGYRVGRYTQPHLVDWRERTWVDGRSIEPDEVSELARRIKPAVETIQDSAPDMGSLTTYEVGTALTLSHFADRRVDIAVLEIGIGGRLDALNAVAPVLSAITSISLDHTDVLGETLEEIAAEKAGILRSGRPAVASPQRPEVETTLRRAAAETGTRLYLVGSDWRWQEGAEPGTFDISGPLGAIEGLRTPLLGDHQRDNATVAAAALQLLGEQGFRIDAEAIRRGLALVEWPGRVQQLRRDPAVVVDAAHNADSARRLLEAVRKHFRYERMILVFGASADKDIAGMALVLGPMADRVIATGSGHLRAAGLEPLAAKFARYAPVQVEPEPGAALHQALALAAPADLVLATGSVFLAGRAIQTFRAHDGNGEGPPRHQDTKASR